MGRTIAGVGLKLLVVFVALMAYVGLRGLETKKSSFDVERGKPILVVEAKPEGTPDYVPVLVNDLKNYLPVDALKENSPAQDKQAQDKNAAAANLSQAEMWGFIDNIKYQPFRTGDDILNRLSEEALTKSAYKKRDALRQQDALSKERALKSAADNVEKIAVEDKLYSVLKAEIEQKFPQESAQKKEDKLQERRKELLKNNQASEAGVQKLKQKYRNDEEENWSKFALYSAQPDELAMWANTLANRIENFQDKIEDQQQWRNLEEQIKNADRTAQMQLQVLHTVFRTKLKDRLSDPSWSDNKVLAYFDPRPMLDDKSGAYVIYQTFRTIAIVVLVLFVLSLFLLLLNRISFFADGSETLKQQIADVFKSGGGGGGGGEGAMPQIAKSLIVTAAALGVGTAVAVAGTSLARSAPPTLEDTDEITTTPNAKNNARLNSQLRLINELGDREPPVKIEFSPDIIHPEPIVIEPKMGDSSFDAQPVYALTQKVDRLMESFAAYTEEARNLRTEVDSRVNSAVAGAKTVIREDVKNDVNTKLSDWQQNTLTPGIAELNSRMAQNNLFNRWETFGLRDRMNTFDTNFGKTLATVSDELASTRNALENLERGQNSGGRNLATRTKQLFSSSNSYMATNQSVATLRRLMCATGQLCTVPVCKPDDEACVDKQEAARARLRILSAMATMVGQPPRKEDNFLGNLKLALTGIDKDEGVVKWESMLKEWKPILLKYTRVAY